MSVRDPRQWQRVQTLFLGAVERPETDRDAFLEASCNDDATVRDAVARLLEADRAGASFIEDAIVQGAGRLRGTSHGADLGVGQRIGPYRLEREIGRGGMGVVFRAERADQTFDKQVALKLIAPGFPDDERTRRFEAERQTLADLEHPAIARLLDGGATEEGRPYLVMELVDGVPIDRYCADHELDLEARLRLFRTVCEAVEHAHQSLVVHRDLKPENILVTASGDVKLLDFGIAKLLDAEAAERPATAGLMTLQYASPEQVKGGPITTASDLYALGLVLYGLLTGTRPYDVVATAPARATELICERDPSPPSQASEARPPVPLARLRGDLDAIVMKALRKERQARYPSAGALVRDLDAFLAGRPVSARHGTVLYRFEKLIRRHRWGTAATVAAVVLGTGFTVRVVQERNRAEQAVTLLSDLIAFAEPAGRDRRAQTAQRLRFDDRTDRLASSLAGRPRLQSRLLSSVGGLYHVLGLDDQAATLLERSVSLLRPHGDDASLAASLDRLGEIRLDGGDFDQAEHLHREALSVRRERLGEDDLFTAESLDNLAHVLIQGGGDAAEAETLYRQALAIRRARLGNDHLLVAESANNLALALQDRGHHGDAEDLLRDALVAYRGQLGEDDPDVAMVAGNLGLLLVETGRPEEAEAFLRQALEIDRRHFGDQHAFVAQDHDNLAWALQKLGRYDEAERAYREALATRRLLDGDDHPSTIASVNNLASLLFDLGRYDEAAASFERVVERFGKVYGGDHPHAVQASINLALALHETGDGEAAEGLLRGALDTRQRQHGSASLATADAQSRLAAVLASRGQSAEAEPLLRDALAVARSDSGADPRHIARMLHDLGQLLMRTERPAEAEPLLDEAHRIRQATLGPDNRHTAGTRALLEACRDDLRQAA